MLINNFDSVFVFVSIVCFQGCPTSKMTLCNWAQW